MSHAIVMHTNGGPEVLNWELHDSGMPQPGEVLVRHEAVGLNYIDVYHRSGLYPLPELPAVPGLEGAGVVDVLGEGVTGLNVGDRVAYAGVPPGAYCEVRRIPAHRLVKIPDTISSESAASMMLQGMTARYLLKGCYQVKKGDTILIQAAAGGVGLIVCQWARYLGATVIGTVSTREKASLASEHGCHHPIRYTSENFAERVAEITDGKGVDVVYDSVGQDTFMKSLDCLRPMGMMVTFGQSSGPVDPLDLSQLASRGSLFVTRPSLMNYTAERDALVEHAEDLFDVIDKDVVKVDIRQTYALADAAKAHRDLEARKTKGSSVFVVGN